MLELTSIQKETLILFSKSPLKDKFYWTGGTLLSFYYLHHRRSEDIDLFTNEKFDFEEVNSFAESLTEPLHLKNIESNKIYNRWEFFLKNKEKLKIEFVLYDHKRLKPTKKWRNMQIDSLEDMATNKTMALIGRNDPKDLVDMYFILSKNKFRIQTLLKWVDKKFGVEISQSTFWSEALKTFKDLDKMKPFLLGNKKEKEVLIEKIKEYFASKSNGYLHKIIG